MKKILSYTVVLVSLVYSGTSPFSSVRAVYSEDNNVPIEEIIDLTVCLEREPVVGNPSDKDSREKYERIIKIWADGIYELSNGANFLGHIRIFPGGHFLTGCDVDWKKYNVHPSANVGAFNHGGTLNYSDYGGYIENDEEDRRSNPYEAAGTLLHESMHYIYGLYDEYGSVDLNPLEIGIRLSVDSPDGWIRIEKGDLTLNKFKLMMEAYQVGTLVKFQNLGGRIPNGFKEGMYSNNDEEINIGNYNIIEKIDASLLKDGVYRVKIKNVQNVDSGIYPWGMSKPRNASSTPNTVSWHSGAFISKNKCQKEPQWQWWNFSTKYNVRKDSPQGMEYRQDDGTVLSGWDVVVRNPELDFGKGIDKRWPRYWFKSLIAKAPSEKDVFSTTTFLNYNPTTTWWPESDATWRESDECSDLTNVNIPFMKAELSGRNEAEYSNITRKHLQIEWLDKTKMEIAIVVDASGSMLNYNKINQAKLAAKFVAGGFLSESADYDASNIRVSVYSFNSAKQTVFPPTWNPSLQNVYDAVDDISASGQTALFDAVSEAINSFSSDESSMKMIYIISDGLDNKSEVTRDQVISLYRNRNISIHTFAYGEDADVKLLQQMANETHGTYSEQDESLFLKIENAVVTVLANAYGKEQIASGIIADKSQSSNIYVEPYTSRIQIYGSFSNINSDSPISVIDENNHHVNATIRIFSIDDRSYFIAEVPLNENINSGIFLKIRNNLNAQLDFRVVADETKQLHAMDVFISEDYSWPINGKFYASVRNTDGFLTNLSYEVVLTGPDGYVENLQLYDNGSNGDGMAEDGIYTVNLPKLTKNGMYEWEIRVSNLSKQAFVTMKGSSLPNDALHAISVDSIPFTLYRNGQFVVHGCCSDPLENTVVALKPNDAERAFLTSNDIDDFQIVGTKSSKSYSLLVKSDNLSSINKVVVYTPQDLINPLYEVLIQDNEENRTSILLSAEYAKNGNILRVVGNEDANDSYTLLLYESDFASFMIGRFESNDDWHSSNTTITLDTKHKSEGVRSLVTPAGWKIIESRDVSTADFVMLGEKIDIDLFVPSSTQNQYWIGNVELWLDVPSSNKHIQFGAQQQIQPYFNSWLTYRFDVPNDALSILSEPHSDAQIQIVLNTADSVWVDNMRFARKLRANTVNKYEPHCPGDEGCTSANPLQLLVNNTIRIVPEGDLWFEVVGIPNDWTPASLHLGISAEDGAELTGFLSLDDSVVPLSDWYFQRGYTFERNRRYLFKLHNLGGRPYRINAWVDGQVWDVASNTTKTTLPWVVRFY